MHRLPMTTFEDADGSPLTLPDGKPAVLLSMFYMPHFGVAKTWAPALDRLEARFADVRCWELLLPGGPWFFRRFWLARGRQVRPHRAIGLYGDSAPLVQSLAIDRGRLTVLLIDGDGLERWRGHGSWSQRTEDGLADALSALDPAGTRRDGRREA